MKWHKLVFRQNQPLHIGSLKWGVISETEVFIPGWTMWGAFTNEYLLKNGFKEIETVKKYFEKITNFYPFLKLEKEEEKEDKDSKPLFPQYKAGSWYLGDEYSEDDFRFKFTDTIVSTAVEPLTREAKDKSLHEFEYILPRSKTVLEEDIPEAIYWLGMLGIEDEDEVEDFLKKGLKVYIGGDRRYGFGELELVSIKIAEEEEIADWNLGADGSLCLSREHILRQFLEFSGGIKFEGEMVLLAGFDFTQSLPRVQNAGYYITAGSWINPDSLPESSYKLDKGKFIKIVGN